MPRRSEMLKIVSPISRRELLAATMGVVGAGRAGWGRVYTARDRGVLRWTWAHRGSRARRTIRPWS
ncbi:hypothetical protein [Mycobacterium haemophilum]|uniref:hypothetical protein n=1 Tax=Mycobacterium haemophilum TaxID=29311 RepID=UPI0012E0B705|nr:hypothetical protein [Mycobacterium haemophilum]